LSLSNRSEFTRDRLAGRDSFQKFSTDRILH
jgi:hypothetical protein